MRPETAGERSSNRRRRDSAPRSAVVSCRHREKPHAVADWYVLTAIIAVNRLLQTTKGAGRAQAREGPCWDFVSRDGRDVRLGLRGGETGRGDRPATGRAVERQCWQPKANAVADRAGFHQGAEDQGASTAAQQEHPQ